MRRRKDRVRIALAYGAVCIVALLLVIDVTRFLRPRAVPALAQSGAGAAATETADASPFAWPKLDTAILKRALRSVIPGLSGNEQRTAAGIAATFSTLLDVVTGAAPNDPKTFLSNQIPLLARVTLPESSDEDAYVPSEPPIEPGNPDERETEPEPEPDPEVVTPAVPDVVSPSVTTPVVSGKQPLILIYSTHARESYLPELRRIDKNATEAFSRNMNITTIAAGAELASVLTEKYGIGTVHSLVIHDDKSRGGAYVESLKTATNLLKQYPSVKMVIDLHRDSPPRATTTAKINGLDTARIQIVVGSDKRLKHPNWQKNYSFAKVVAAEMERKYPGLSRGVSVHSDRYNQHLSPGSLIFEVGGIENSLEEVKRSVRLLADVINELVKKNALPK
ncbi:MAG: stage II sporulation protein P [Chloroflexota bacterium]